MRHGLSVLVVLGPILAACHADDAARSIVGKAFEAQGGALRAKLPGSSSRIKGTMHREGKAVAVSGEQIKFGEKGRYLVEMELAGRNLSMTVVIAGNKGWMTMKINGSDVEGEKDTVIDLPQEKLAVLDLGRHVEKVASLTWLANKDFVVESGGQVDVENKAATMVRVTAPGRPAVNLFFDHSSSLLTKIEYRSRERDDREVTVEIFPSEHQVVQGIRAATRFVTKHDGIPFMELELSDLRFLETIDELVFARP